MILVDSDYLYSYFHANQSTHYKAVEIMSTIINDELYICNLVLQELASVLSRKENQSKSIQTIRDSRNLGLNVLLLNTDEENEIWKIFESQTKNKTSFIDCANLYLATKYDLKIASFDCFYPVETLVKP